MDIFRKWRKDAVGWYIEMDIGGQKDWGIDWNRFIASGDALYTASWTMPASITKISQQESGNLAKVTIATPAGGVFSCSHLLTTALGIRESLAFRVIVR